ncbi:metalloregulator ArsR/SmtB family transcription factor [Thermomicrobium sp. 4228-Ro]|uniref:ArsR/SmtB family transcription factor n=1 Tax=Thermomicrobium sp. 4228-Ro TaxID=2993937 RepID=UPI0022492189|nr:metalloregulator ArsR/SmtB family transcription factor [Thermomicrobium sp. 4228-Ro]MCX2727063.1 metalloregulator ArsR/SmtB family transcription factor [Thermomicrobium sp. 4228-Ro]
MLDRHYLELKAKLFRGFADPSRLAILEVLRGGPRTVGEIARLTGQGVTNVSNHLRCLRDCGLVVRERRGQHAVYRLADERCAQLFALAEQLLAESARGVLTCPKYTLLPLEQHQEQEVSIDGQPIDAR